MKKEIVKTRDGSNTLFVPEFDETYHSTHGAIQESLHVFIRSGLKFKTELNDNIFFLMQKKTIINPKIITIKAHKK